jgi:hypothetical protein
MKAKAIKCRQIGDSDLEAVVELLVAGFPERDAKYWSTGLKRLSERKAIADYPRFGYLLENGGRLVGVLLTIFAECESEGRRYVRCNLSSWHVASELRSYGALLVSSATRRPEVTYLNVSPAPHTRATIEVQGFKRICRGLVVSAPALGGRVRGARVTPFDPADQNIDRLSDFERRLMRDHADLGCLTLVCARGDEVSPFVFLPSERWKGRIRSLHLGYCRRTEDFVKFSGPLGRALRKRAWFVTVDANGPIEGLPGPYVDRDAKYFKGPVAPRLGDLAYVEDVFFH